jgi:signal transduction histidine kinase/AmiR/NasT family two-component response regulator
MWWSWLDRLAGTTDDTGEGERRWRGRFVVALWLAGSFASGLQCVSFLAAGNAPNALATVVGLGLELGWLLMWRRWKRPALQGDAFGALGSAVYGASLLFNKDLGSLLWLGVVPLLTLFIGGRRAGVRWFFIDASIAVVGTLLVTTGHAPPPVVPVVLNDVIARLVSVLVVLSAVGLLWDLSARSIMKDLSRATTAAQAAAREKGRFLANVSHELRTPLHGLLGMAQLLKNETLSEAGRANLAVMEESGRLLQRLIDDLLEVTSDQRSFTPVEAPTRLDRLLSEVLAGHHQKTAAGGQVALSLQQQGSTDVCVHTDGKRLTQALSHLVGNALKFTPRGGRVDVRLNVPADGEVRQVTVQVTDTGRGLTVEEQGRLFKPFSRLHDAPNLPGTGLGLSITRSIIERLGGSLSVESTPGKGSTFTINLALEVRPEPRSQAPPPNNIVPLNARLSVLVVDDNAINRRVALGQLEKLGCTACAVNDGAQAVERLRAHTFDLVLMDRHMPVMDGLDATVALRHLERPLGLRTPVVGVTASVLPEDLEACLGAGMDEVLTKPLALDTLRGVVQAISERRFRGRAEPLRDTGT